MNHLKFNRDQLGAWLISYLLVFFLFFFLPVGWAKHWLLSQSLVNGVLVDYLMPDFWFQDLLALLLLLMNWRTDEVISFFKDWRVVWGLLFIGGSIFHSSVPLISLVYALRFFLLLLLVLHLKGLLQKRPKLVKAAYQGLAGAMIWTSLLAMAQLINQGTVFGWWFLGEPVFQPGSGGVKKIIFGSKTLVMPLATLPHFNVLLAFLVFSLLLFSQRGAFLFLAGLVVFKLLTFQPSSFWRRWQLIKLSLAMIQDHFFWGVGWGCFVKKLPAYWQELSLTSRFLQPVHNIFLIILSELGFLGSLGFLAIIIRLYKRVIVNFSTRVYLLFSLFFFFGFLDHYFWTTTQGLYLAFLLPLLAVFSKQKPEPAKRLNQ